MASRWEEPPLQVGVPRWKAGVLGFNAGQWAQCGRANPQERTGLAVVTVITEGPPPQKGILAPGVAGGPSSQAVGAPGRNPTWGPKEVDWGGLGERGEEVRPLKAEKRPEQGSAGRGGGLGPRGVPPSAGD